MERRCGCARCRLHVEPVVWETSSQRITVVRGLSISSAKWHLGLQVESIIALGKESVSYVIHMQQLTLLDVRIVLIVHAAMTLAKVFLQ